MAGTNHKEGIQVVLFDKEVKVGINENKTRIRAPVSQNARLNVIFCQWAFEQSILFNKNHGCVALTPEFPGDERIQTCGNVAAGSSEGIDSIEFIYSQGLGDVELYLQQLAE